MADRLTARPVSDRASPADEQEVSYREAFADGLREAMDEDDHVIVMGEDIAGGAGRAHLGIIEAWGGPFRFTKGLIARFGAERVRDTPISEAAFVGAAVGAAMTGYRPVVDLMFNDFVGTCFDQMMNSAAKMRYMSGGRASVPLTVFTRYGTIGGAAAQHSQTLYSLIVHIPGLKCVVPSDPYTVKGLLRAAIDDDDPVVLFNDASLTNVRGVVPTDAYAVPIGKSRTLRSGSDVTLVGVGRTTGLCSRAAETLSHHHGISSEVIDLLSLSPLDIESLVSSARRTGRVVVVDAATPRCGVAFDVAAQITTAAFGDLRSPVSCLTAPHAPVPYSKVLEELYGLSEGDIVKAVVDQQTA